MPGYGRRYLDLDRMQFKLSQLLIAVAVLGVVCWFAAPREIAVLDGRFNIALNLPKVDPSTPPILVAYCWNKTEATHAAKHGSTTNEITFRPIETGVDGTDQIDIPFSAKHGPSGREVSYHEPEYIVIQFDHDGILRRKIIEIPSGRGDRSISIDFD